MLVQILADQWQGYINEPEVRNGTVVLRSLIPAPPSLYKHGLAMRGPLPEYSPGDVLQWAILARTSTPPAVLNIGVQSGKGDENTLSVRDLNISEAWGWVVSEPLMANTYKSLVFLYTPDLGKEIEIKKMALGDPDSIEEYMQGPLEVGPSLLPWVIGGTLGILGLIAIAKKQK